MHRNGGTPGGEARRRHLPALLDLLFPGLGHLFAGRRRRAALFGLPVIGAIVIGALIVASTSIPRLAATLFNPAVLWALLALQPLFLVWRLLAVAASLWDPSLPRPGRVEAIPIVAILALAVVAPQAYAGYATEVARETADEIFAEPSSTALAGPLPSAEPDPSFLIPASASPSATASLSPSPTPAVPRVNVLLVGVDAGVGRNTYLTDTMIVASLDPTTKTVSMVSVPRDMVDVPLPDGRRSRARSTALSRTPATILGSSPDPTGPASTSCVGRSANCSASTSDITPRSPSRASSTSSTSSAG